LPVERTKVTNFAIVKGESLVGSKKWCVKDARLYHKPGGTKQNRYITIKRVYDVSDNQEVANRQKWSEIKFIDRQGVERTGWVQDVYLEELIEDPTSQGFEVSIPNPTQVPTDAAQFMMWDGHIKRNMCGELCVAFIGGDDIETFLSKWKQMDRTHYHLVVPKDRTTGTDVVDNMLNEGVWISKPEYAL